MKSSPLQIVRQVYEQIVDESQRKQFPALEQYLETQGSVCVLAQKGVDGLMREYGLDLAQAKPLQERINGLATLVLRRYIEHELSGNDGQPEHLRHGLLALVRGPTYELLFKPNEELLCPPNALEAIHSPVSYLVTLMLWSRKLIRLGDSNALPLSGRRTDLVDLLIDEIAVNRAVPSVEVVTHILETFITANDTPVASLDLALSTRRYPNGLPFHRPWVTLDYVARQSAESVGSVVRLCDPQFPYFIRSAPWGGETDTAMLFASRLSPSQRILLTEPSNVGEDEKEAFYKNNFGLVKVEPENLPQVFFFNQRTKLDQSGIEALLSVESFAPTASPNVTEQAPDLSISGANAGSVFINAPRGAPLAIQYAQQNFLHMIMNVSDDRFDRMNRKLRLDNWLALPSHEGDALIVAAINAENEAAGNFWMTDNTIRALGLFQELREGYQCSAEDFAAFIDRISIFGRGTQTSQFDRIFNENTLFSRPLLLDDGAFPIVPQTDEDILTVNQLRAGLSIDRETYFFLAHVVAGAFGVTELKRSLPMLSSFYRMVKLPRMLGVTPIEAFVLLGSLGGATWLSALAGQPRISSTHGVATPDALNVTHALMDCVRWCRDSGLAVHWVAQQVVPITAPARAGEAQQALFVQMRNRLPPALMTEQRLTMAGVAPLTNNRLWLNALQALVDEHGLVRHFTESADQPYEAYAREMIDRAVRAALGAIDQSLRVLLVEKILGVMLGCRAGQQSVVRESLTTYAQLASERVLPVLAWSGGTVYDVLTQTLLRTPDESLAGARKDEELPGDPFLGMLADFVRRAAVAQTLELSPAFLTLYMQVGYSQWLNQRQPEAFTLTTLYYLTVYRRALQMTGKPEEQLLDYLQSVNTLPDNLTGDGLLLVRTRAAKRLAELFAWSVAEVRACAGRVNPGDGAGSGIVRSLVHFDLLTRVRAFAERSGLDGEAILAMGTLPVDETTPFNVYERVADQVATSLQQARETVLSEDVEAVNQDVLIDIEVDKARVVANNPADFATFTVTIKNRAGVVQKNVNVHWTSQLGYFEAAMTTTGDDGTTTAKYFGKKMGTEVVSYAMDLDKKRSAKPIEIGFDVPSLQIRLPSPVPDKPLVGTLVTLSVVLLDRYTNRPSGQTIWWTPSPLPTTALESLTDSNGRAEITFTSDKPATVKVTAKLGASGPSLQFPEFSFVDAP